MIKLTEEQKKSIAIYREKWRDIIFSTEPLNRDKTTEVIKNLYKLLDRPEPKIIFFDSPYALAKDLNKNFYLYKETTETFRYRDEFRGKSYRIFWTEHREWSEKLEDNFGVDYEFTRDDRLHDRADEIFWKISYQEIEERFLQENEKFNDNILGIQSLLINDLFSYCAWYDFCFSELKIEDNAIARLILEIHQYCGKIFSYPQVCLLCDRPHLRFAAASKERSDDLALVNYPLILKIDYTQKDLPRSNMLTVFQYMLIAALFYLKSMVKYIQVNGKVNGYYPKLMQN